MKNNYEESLFILECAVLNIQENASNMDYSPEAIDRLKNAYDDMQELVKRVTLNDAGFNCVSLADSDKPRVFFDMDGTLSVWEDNPIEEVAKAGYFYARQPQESVVGALKALAESEECEVYILSSTFIDDHSVSEKVAWNALYTKLPRARQLYVPYGMDKDEFLMECGGIKKTDILVDDFSYNLHRWKGVGIKVLNGVNGTKGTWHGPMIRYTDPVDEIVKTIVQVAKAAREA